MGKGSAHTGYRSFEYLRRGVDYRASSSRPTSTASRPHGYSDDEIAKAAGGNTLRVWEECV